MQFNPPKCIIVYHSMATEESNNKESPLTDIATSPPPFDLSLGGRELETDENHRFASDKDTPNVGRSENSSSNRESYESSELSDLGDDDSEAETDKMDFLEDENNSSTERILDLNAISKLTEMARLKGVDSDDDVENENGNENRAEVKDEAHGIPATDRENHDPPKAEDHDDENDEASSEHEVSSGNEMSLNPKDNAEANKEILKDLENISHEVGDNRSRRSSKRSVLDQEQTSQKKPRLKNEPVNEEDDGENGRVPDSTKRRKKNSVDVDASQKDDSNDNGNSADDDENEAGNGEEKTDAQEADEEDEDEIGDERFNEDGVDMNEQQKLAIEELISIESLFAGLRDKLYQDKLNLLEHELQLCLEGSHPELSKIYYKITQFHQDSLKQANSNLNYKLKCIDIETVGSRTSIHQNFLKNLMDSKNDMITDTTSLWYKINKERNQLDQLVPEYNFTAIPLIPNYTVAVPHIDDGMAGPVNGMPNGAEVVPLSKKAIKQNTVLELVEHRNNINYQIGILNGLFQFHGFPSALCSTVMDDNVAPSQDLILKKATEEEINDDLKAMGIPI